MLETVMRPVAAIRTKGMALAHEAGIDEDGIGIKTLLRTRIVDSRSLAYLWMAIESNLNVLILGDGLSGGRPFMYSLFPLIPPYDRTIAFDCHAKNSRYHENLISYVPCGRHEVSGALKSARELLANRIVVADLEKFSREVFSCANWGIPFISTMAGEEPRIVDSLKKKRVPANSLSMLDVVVSMGKADDSVWRVNGISEYLWFSRSEYFIEEAVASKNFEFRTNCVLAGGKFNSKSLPVSKAMKAYSDLNVVGKKEAVEEFGRRSAFLAGSLDSNLPSKEYIDSYFEIK